MEERVKDGDQQMSQKEVEKIKEAFKTLREENNKLREIIQELSDARFLQRLDYLFKIVEYSKSFAPEVVGAAIREIVKSVFPPIENKEEDNGKQSNTESGN